MRQQIEKAEALGKKLTYTRAHEEVIADSMETMLADGTLIEKLRILSVKDKSIVAKIENFLKNLVSKIKKAYEGLRPDSQEGRIVAEIVDTSEQLHQLFADAIADASENFKGAEVIESASSENKNVKASPIREGRKASLKNSGNALTDETIVPQTGTDVNTSISENGIEVYETSEEIKALPYSERKKIFNNLMSEQFYGRTAKFFRNGHAYYAKFDVASIDKNISGDNKSSPMGWKAKINVGADGNIFELVENSLYDRSRAEKGKKDSPHKSVKYWDYFVKTVQIDNKVYDVLINIRRKTNQDFVYSIRLWENKKIRVSPPIGPSKKSSVNSGAQHSAEIVPQNGTDVKTSISEKGVKYSFAGREAKTSDIKTLESAIRLENVGKATSEEIRQQTGWFRGMDGKWRFEISDRDIEIDTTGKFHTNPDVRRYMELFDKVFVNMNASEEEATELRSLDENLKGVSFEPRTLGELIKHDKLFAAYPQLKEISVHFADIDERGIYDPISKILVLQSRLKLDKSKLEKTLVHEIQHAIQDIEGFASGSSPDSWRVAGVSKKDAYSYYERTAGEIEARDAATRSWRTDEARKEKRPDIDRTDVVFADGGESYSIVEPFTDEEGNSYDGAVLLDTKFFDGLSPYNWSRKLSKYVFERSSNNPFILPIIDENGDIQQLQFAKPNERVTKNGKSNHKVLDELSYSKDNISKLAVVHIDEIVSISEENNPYYTNEHNHQWLDERGWLHRNAYVINNKNGNVFNLTLDIAKTRDGRFILFATKGKIKKVGNVQLNSLKIKGSGLNSNYDSSISDFSENVKQKQLEIIEKVNPAPNTYNTWIRKVEDIKTLSETLEDSDWADGDEFNPDLARSMIEEAIEKGEITVYSSYPIEQGVFVSPSYMEAESYSGDGKVYEKTVSINDVAWIDPTQGMYANINEKFSDRDPNALTPRNLLANALEESAVHEVEKKKLAEYKDNIEKLYAKEQELYEVRKEIKKLSFAPGKKDTAKIKKLQEKAVKLSNSVTFYDKKLLNLESTSFLKNVLEREKSKAIKRQKEKDAERLKAQKEKALQTAMRNKIKS